MYCAHRRAQRCSCFTPNTNHTLVIIAAGRWLGLSVWMFRVSTSFRSINEIPGRDAVAYHYNIYTAMCINGVNVMHRDLYSIAYIILYICIYILLLTNARINVARSFRSKIVSKTD